MDVIIRRKILKFTIIIAFIFTFIFLVGCSDSSNTLKTLSTNMDKVINDINKVEAIDNSSLIIEDFIDENNLQFYDIETPTLYQTHSSKIDNYVLKIKLLNNSIYNTIELNNQINGLKKHIVSKAHQIKSFIDQCLEDKCNLDDKILDTLEELNNSVMAYTSRIYLSRNETKNHINSIKQIKAQYSSKSEQLSTRYEKLQASLNTRLSYYININDNLNSIAYTISSNATDCNNLCYNCKDCDDYVDNKEQEQTVTASTEKENNTWLKKNIDTYENAGKDIYGFNKKYPNYNRDNYLNGYGYYSNPNFYGNGFGGYGYGMYNNGFGMPYGFGYGMTYPNINSFGTYKNIDTYKIQPNPFVKGQDKENNNTLKEEQHESAPNNAYDVDDKIEETSSDVVKHKQQIKLPKPLISDQDEFNYINPPPPMPKPYIPPFELDEPVDEGYTHNDINSQENTPKTLEYLEENAEDDGEDKFVSTKPVKPKIEKLEN